MMDNQYFFGIARAVAEGAHDDRRQVGAVIVSDQNQILATGFNGLPRRTGTIGEDKYLYIEHAERNAIYQAARHGISIQNARMYVTGLPPCADCARAIIQTGLWKVYFETPEKTVPEHWSQSVIAANNMLLEADVEVEGRWAVRLGGGEPMPQSEGVSQAEYNALFESFISMGKEWAADHTKLAALEKFFNSYIPEDTYEAVEE